MSFIITANGAEYRLDGLAMLDPAERPVHIDDIAHLSQINRFTGACKRPYSVAEHSLFVSEIAQRNGCGMGVQLAALLHDAHEAYISELSSPAKNAVDYLATLSGGTGAWKQFEDIHAKHVREQLRISSVCAGAKTDPSRPHGIQILSAALEALSLSGKTSTCSSTSGRPSSTIRCSNHPSS